MNFFPGPPQTRALVGAAEKWQQRQRRGEKLLRCPRRRFGAWSNPSRDAVSEPEWPRVNRSVKPTNHRACPTRPRPSGSASLRGLCQNAEPK
eukprot:1161773-Pelagomonas_calceolata.AAC.14